METASKKTRAPKKLTPAHPNGGPSADQKAAAAAAANPGDKGTPGAPAATPPAPAGKEKDARPIPQIFGEREGRRLWTIGDEAASLLGRIDGLQTRIDQLLQEAGKIADENAPGGGTLEVNTMANDTVSAALVAWATKRRANARLSKAESELAFMRQLAGVEVAASPATDETAWMNDVRFSGVPAADAEGRAPAPAPVNDGGPAGGPSDDCPE